MARAGPAPDAHPEPAPSPDTTEGVDDMLALSDLIEFLLELMRDPAAAAEFENDPDATLAARGLQDVSAQDVRDARLMLQDDGVQATGNTAAPGGDDPIQEINHTRANYSAEHHHPAPVEPVGLVAHAAAPITIDDRDTFIIDNSDDDITVIRDAFNTDNSVNNNDVLAINDSFNDLTRNDVDILDIDDSFNDGAPIDTGDGIGDGNPLPTGPLPTGPDPDAPIDPGDGIGDGAPLPPEGGAGPQPVVHQPIPVEDGIGDGGVVSIDPVESAPFEDGTGDGQPLPEEPVQFEDGIGDGEPLPAEPEDQPVDEPVDEAFDPVA